MIKLVITCFRGRLMVFRPDTEVDDVAVEAVLTRVCPQCGFDWTLADAVALDVVGAAPSLYSRDFGGREGARYGAGGSWSPREYLWHVVDVLRQGAENLWMLTVDPTPASRPGASTT